MARDPAFLWYPGDWLGGTMTFTRHEKGAYMDLLMAQFNNGKISQEEIKTILGNDDFDKIWEGKLKKKFKKNGDGLFYNEKLDYEVNRRKNFVESRRQNLKKH
jgi:uncharacterized protein YdaU (DUF1376 family)